MRKFDLKNFFSSDRRILYVIFVSLLISVFSLTIGYAALSVTLNIQGNAEVVASTWDVYLDNAKVTSGSVSGTVPTITNKTTASFSTTLTEPGDFYEFSIDVVNGGTIDAMIESISKTPTLTESQSKYLKYIIEYQNGEAITTKQLVNAGSFVRLKVRIEYRSDISASDIPTTSETLNLKFTVNYTQSDASGSSVADDGVYDPYKIGTEHCFDSECFYVISSDDDTVTMLAKYNLYVGGYHDMTTGELILYGAEATGLQDSTMLGADFSNSELLSVNGVTKFSNTNVDYEGSIVEGYVNNYKSIIETEVGIKVEEARLITTNELENSNTFACDHSIDSCSDIYPWIYSTSYWSMSSDDSLELTVLLNNGLYGKIIYDYGYSLIQYCGVRPVIVISKDYF